MKLTKGISLLLIVCMLLTSLGTITFAAETARYSLSLSGPITVRGEQATISVLKETVNDETKVHSAATVVSGVTFTSSDENVLTIGADGKITAKKVGTATIKATGDGLPTTLHMLAIVTLEGPDAKTVVNFDDKTPGDYTRSSNSQQATSIYLDLPHKIVTAPAFGGKGNALYLPALNPADYANKGWTTGVNWAEYPLFQISEDEDDQLIIPGKISQFWWYYPEYSVRNNWYIQMYLPSGNYAKIKLHNLNANYPLNLARIENFNNRGTAVFSKGNSSCNWGGEYAYLNYGWNQVTVDASSVDPTTGNGAYNIYINSDKIGVFTESTGNQSGSGRIVFNRQLDFASTLTSSPAYFDNFGIYELVLPEEVDNTLDLGAGGSVLINGKSYSKSGTISGLNEGDTHEVTAQPNIGYMMDTVTYNGEAVTDNKFTVVKNGVLKVTFKADETEDEKKEYTLSSDGAILLGQQTKAILTETKSRVAVTSQRQMTDEPTEVVSGATFTSSDNKIVSIDETGLMTGNAVGTAKISAYIEGAEVGSFLAVVSGGVVTETNYDGTDLPEGEQIESLYSEQGGNATAAYEYVTAPRLGLSGKALHLKQIYATDMDKALTDTSGYNWIPKLDAVANGGKTDKGTVTELWYYHSRTAMEKGDTIWFQLGSHSFLAMFQNANSGLNRGEFSVNSHNQWWGRAGATAEYANDTSIGAYSNTFTYKIGWNQIVIDGSEILENGGVKYKFFVNGNNVYNVTINPTADKTIEEGIEQIRFVRSLLNRRATSDTWVDGYKVYKMDAAPYVSNVKITGKNEIGNTIKGSYIFSQGYGSLFDEEAEEYYNWYQCDTEDGEYELIENSDDKSMELTSEMKGTWLKFGVTLGDKIYYSDPVQVMGVGETNVAPELYVAKNGKDSNDGSIDAPFASLEKARDTIRLYKENDLIPDGGITVYIREGIYQLGRGFLLTEEDSGTPEKPIIYQAYNGESVTFSGGATMTLDKFTAVSGEMKDKLSYDNAKENVIVGKLSDFGLDTPEKYKLSTASYNAPLILYDGQAMRLAKYPNSNSKTDWMKCDILNRGKCNRYSATDYRQGTGLMKFKYYPEDEARIEGWSHNTDDIIYNGYWAETWINEVIYGNMDKEANTIEATAAMTYGGAAYQADGKTALTGIGKPIGINYYAMNVYEEIDEPGEFYIDRKTGLLYLYPINDNENAEIKMTNLNADLISVQNASYITISGIELTSGRQYGVNLSGCDHVVVKNCDLNSCEKRGINITNSTNSGIMDSHIHQNGAGAINMDSCGNRDTLEEANCFITNNDIHDNTILSEYANQIDMLNCVGCIIDHNEIYNTPHIAINFTGCYNVMEYNYFHHVVTNTADTGAIYTGRHWQDHGNIVRYNHFSDLGNPRGGMLAAAFFTDDGSSDCDIYGNVFGPNLDDAHVIKVHAGQNNNFEHNLFINTPYFYYAYIWDNNKWANHILGENGADTISYRDRLLTIAANPLYIERWPWVQDAFKPRKEIKHLGNTLGNNLIIMIDNELRGGNPLKMNETGPVRYHGNDESPLYGWSDKNTNKILLNQSKSIFADYDGGDYTIVDASVYPEGFPVIPFASIGRMDTEDRDEWLETAKELKKVAKAGTKIGEYPQEAIDALNAAIKEAQDAEPIVGVKALQEAVENLKASCILEDSVEDNQYILPENLNGVVLNTGDVSSGLTLQLKGTLGRTELKGTFGAQEYTAEIQAGTTVSPQMIVLSSPDTNSFGTQISDEVVLSIGTSETTFSTPVRMVLTGMGKMRVFHESDGKLSSMAQMSADDASAMKKNFGYVRDGSDLILWLKQGGEIVLGSNIVLPSNSPTVKPTTPSGNPGSGGGTSTGSSSISVGNGSSSNGQQNSSKPAQTSKFTDIIGHWAEKDINEMATKGIVSGVTETTFEPDRSITRAEFAALAARALKLSVANTESVFNDVSNDAWYAKEVGAAAAAGLIVGYDGNFRPNDTITREEMAVVIMKAYQFLGKAPLKGKISQFADKDTISAWAVDYVDGAVSSGLISGMTTDTFAPSDNATRAQVASIIKRLLDK